MTELVNFFSDVPLSFRTLILLGGIVFFWILEGMLPLYSFGLEIEKTEKTRQVVS